MREIISKSVREVADSVGISSYEEADVGLREAKIQLRVIEGGIRELAYLREQVQDRIRAYALCTRLHEYREVVVKELAGRDPRQMGTTERGNLRRNLNAIAYLRGFR